MNRTKKETTNQTQQTSNTDNRQDNSINIDDGLFVGGNYDDRDVEIGDFQLIDDDSIAIDNSDRSVDIDNSVTDNSVRSTVDNSDRSVDINDNSSIYTDSRQFTDNRQIDNSDRSVDIFNRTTDNSVRSSLTDSRQIDNSDRSVDIFSTEDNRTIDKSDRSSFLVNEENFADYSSTITNIDRRTIMTDGGAIESNRDVSLAAIDLAGDANEMSYMFAGGFAENAFGAIEEIMAESGENNAALARSFGTLADKTRSESTQALEGIVKMLGIVGTIAAVVGLSR